MAGARTVQRLECRQKLTEAVRLVEGVVGVMYHDSAVRAVEAVVEDVGHATESRWMATMFDRSTFTTGRCARLSLASRANLTSMNEPQAAPTQRPLTMVNDHGRW